LRVEAAGLNFHDVMVSLGLMPELSIRERPGTELLGLDCAGVVTAVGDGVHHLAVGDEAMGVAYGSFGSYVTGDAQLLVRRPAGLDAVAAAGTPVAFATARIALLDL